MATARSSAGRVVKTTRPAPPPVKTVKVDGTADVAEDIVTALVPAIDQRKPDTNEYGTVGVNVVIQNFGSEEAISIQEVPLTRLIAMIHNDGNVAGLMNIIKLPIVASEFDILPFDGKSQTEAAFVEQNLTAPAALGGMSTSMRYLISDMCMAVATGFRVYERVWEQYEGAIRYKKIAPRNPLTIRLRQDQQGGFNGFVQRILAGTAALVPGAAFTVSSTNDKVIEREKALLFVRNKEENPLYGRSDFLPVFYHYDKLHKLYYIAHLAYQLEAIPMRIGTFPVGADKADKDKFFLQLSRLGFDSSMMVPQGFDVKEFGAQRAGRNYMDLIEHHKTAMYSALLAQFMHLGQSGASHGSFAASKTFSGVFLMALEAITADIDEMFNNYVIPPLVDYNFTSHKYPRLKHKPMDSSRQEAIQNVFMKILSSPADHATPEFILAMEEELARDFDFNIDYSKIREQRLAQLVQNQITNGQRQSGAMAQLAETFIYDEDNGTITATDKTYDILKGMLAERDYETMKRLGKMNVDLTADNENLRTKKDDERPVLNIHLGEYLHIKEKELREEAEAGTRELAAAVTKQGEAILKLAESEAGRTISITTPEPAQIVIPEGAIKVEVHPNVEFKEGAIQVTSKEADATKVLTMKRSEDGTTTTITRE